MQEQCPHCNNAIATDEISGGRLHVCKSCNHAIVESRSGVDANDEAMYLFATAEPISPKVRLDLCLRSGATISIVRMKLYPASCIRQLANATHAISSKFQPDQSGIGYIGSPGWVFMNMFLDEISGSVTQGSREREVDRLVKEYHEILADKQKRGAYICVNNVRNTHSSLLSHWAATFSRKAKVKRYGFLKIDTDIVLDTIAYTHDNEPFVEVEDDKGIRFTLIWENVERLRIVA